MRELLKLIFYIILTAGCIWLIKVGPNDLSLIWVIAILVGVLTSIMIFYQLYSFARYLRIKGKKHSINWTYQRDEWLSFSKGEIKKRAQESKKMFIKSLIIIPFMILILVFAFFANILKGQSDTANAIVSPFVINSTLYILLSIVVFLFIWYLFKSVIFYLESLLTLNPKVLAGKSYVILNSELYYWGKKHSRVLEKRIINNKMVFIKYKIKTSIGGSNNGESLFREISFTIPIPQGKLEEAQIYIKSIC